MKSETVINAGPFIFQECLACGRGGSLDRDLIYRIQLNKTALNEIYRCGICKKEYSIEEGIIQSLISNNIFSQWYFISNIVLHGVCEIIVGNAHHVKLSQKVDKINKIYLTPQEGCVETAPIIYNSDTFSIISAQHFNIANLPPDSPFTKNGEKLKLGWTVYGRDNNVNFPIWRGLLFQAREQIIQERYTLSVLISAIAFESFLDSLIRKILIKKGISHEAAETITDSMRSIFDKVHKLLFQEDGIDFKKNKTLNKNWQELVEKRNEIAHGAEVSIKADEAKHAFETVIRGVFFLNREASVNLF